MANDTVRLRGRHNEKLAAHACSNGSQHRAAGSSKSAVSMPLFENPCQPLRRSSVDHLKLIALNIRTLADWKTQKSAGPGPVGSPVFEFLWVNSRSASPSVLASWKPKKLAGADRVSTRGRQFKRLKSWLPGVTVRSANSNSVCEFGISLYRQRAWTVVQISQGRP